MPPSRDRTSFWRRTFDEARRHGDWYRVGKFYTRNTAAQIASDIRRAHRVGRRATRTAGIRSGEVWEARWNEVKNGATGDYEVWIRRAG